jgi:hypothetical protein
LEQILSSIRLLENATVQRGMQRLFRTVVAEQRLREIAPEIISAEEVVSSEVLS